MKSQVVFVRRVFNDAGRGFDEISEPAAERGGSFGVATAVQFDLYPVPTVCGGSLVYPGEMAAEALRFYRDWIVANLSLANTWNNLRE